MSDLSFEQRKARAAAIGNRVTGTTAAEFRLADARALGDDEAACDTCNGTGQVACPDCNGAGDDGEPDAPARGKAPDHTTRARQQFDLLRART